MAQRSSDYGYSSLDYNSSSLPLPYRSNNPTASGNYDLPIPFGLPPPQSSDRKRKYDLTNSTKLPSFFEDLKRSKLQPTYSNELASKLNSLDSSLGLPQTHSSNSEQMLPPLNSNKYGGFNNQQDLLDASSFFNQISNSMNNNSTNNNSSDSKPTIPSISSLSGSNNKNLYPIFPSSTNASTTATTTAPNTHTSPLLSGPTLPSSSSFYPQLNRSSQQYSDSNDFVKKLNIGSSQKTSADELAKRLASMQIESTTSETDDSETDDDFKDYSSYYDQSDDEYDDMEEEIKVAEFSYHRALIESIREYLDLVVSSVQGEQQSCSDSSSSVVEPVVKNAATRLYPVIKV
ncbi:unnamed protein product [Ambrosiozyma monospora]|uniref:Unnamed protein product n=1 Tax=Ambrosiozyma monospora TaxID=43982 RepID=A0ACB5TC60_AMBMO|nr:unnamed protein product [Ambrosiozyma monospora]